MPQVRSIERRISALEGFDVRIVTGSGANVRSDRVIPNQYDDHKNRAAGTLTVESWKRARFRPQFSGFDIEVLDGDGRPVHGRTHLRTVRETYAV